MAPPEPARPAITIHRRRERARMVRGAAAPGRQQRPADADIDLIRRSSANVLLVGPDDSCEAALRAVWPDLPAPVVFWRRTEPLAVAAQARTLILHGADGLLPHEQDYLFDRLGKPLAPRVVAIAATSLFERVVRGDFRAALYYRLNTIFISFAG